MRIVDEVRAFWADYMRRVEIVRARQQQREEAVDDVSAHPGRYIGKSIDTVFEKCGQPDHSSSFDFGLWVAEWDRRDHTRLSVFVENEVCTRIE